MPDLNVTLADSVSLRLAQVDPHSIEGMMRLRLYQLAAATAAFEVFVNGHSTLIVMATGLGKTIVFSHIALCWPNELGRVLVLAHREELIDQNAEKVAYHTGEQPGIEMGSRREGSQGHGILDRSKVLVSSIQSMSKRLKKFDPQDFGLVIVDEAHHSTATSYRKVIEYFQQNPLLRLLGVTATPKRTDEQALGQIYDSCCYQMDIERGIAEGWLVDVEQKYIVVKGLDFSAMKTTAGDLNERDLETGLLPGANIDTKRTDLTDEERDQLKKQEAMLHAIVDPTVKEANGRSTLVFGVTVAHATRLCEVFNRHPGVKAECVFGTTPRELRKEIIGKFRGGHLQVLVGCAVFTEGFDAPETAVVAVARPTKSLTMYTQIIGRGTRPLPGIIECHATPEDRRSAIAASRKSKITVLDFVGNSGRHKLVSSVDVLGGKYPSDEVEAARQWMIEHDEAKTIDQAVADELARREERKKAIAEAREKAAATYRAEQERRRLEAEKRRSVVGKATYSSEYVDPFGHKTVPERVQGTLPNGTKKASEPMVKFLIVLGVKPKTAETMSFNQARAVIGKLSNATGREYVVRNRAYRGKRLKDLTFSEILHLKSIDNDPQLHANIGQYGNQLRAEKLQPAIEQPVAEVAYSNPAEGYF